MALVPPFFLDCVTAIGFRNTSNEPVYGATGFLFGKLTKQGPAPEAREYRVYLVTNRHVFANQRTAVLRFNPSAGAPARTFDLPLQDGQGKPLWSVHANPDVDAAAIPINIVLLKTQGIQFSFFAADQATLTLAQAAQNDLSEGHPIFVLGFPLGDVGGVRNHVVVRQGVVARIRDAIAGTAHVFVIDATVFPGNSGGPVVTKPELVSITGTKAYPSASLVGMVAAYVSYRDIAVSQQTGNVRVIFEENTGLSLVVPVDRISEVVELADTRMMGEVTASGSA